MPKPAILVVPGSFSLPKFYDPLVDQIAARGYEIRALHLPSVRLQTETRDGPPPTMYDDAAWIAKETGKLVEEGKDVILLAHSYGGTPTTESTKGLSKKERTEQGKQGGVVQLAYMSAIVPKLGMPTTGIQQDEPGSSRLHLVGIDESGWMYYHDPKEVQKLVFSDLPPEEAVKVPSNFGQHSAASFGGPLTHAGYLDIPVSYLFCENDEIVTPAVQQKIINMIESESQQKVSVTKIQTGHAPNVTAPETVINWVLGVAKEVDCN